MLPKQLRRNTIRGRRHDGDGVLGDRSESATAVSIRSRGLLPPGAKRVEEAQGLRGFLAACGVAAPPTPRSRGARMTKRPGNNRGGQERARAGGSDPGNKM